ncbi:hypothetical protein E3N88_28177 [Mikania micrantha]|uniref:Retroviral polymerase SH3-like domain-containing protein n=1 Tax=Mikania micrantha TaxID=192012 RepID=A0A5N6MZS4_9ASTR|nr:hypothetical protein E3N88_28177 [Mikania micrantha]
MLVETQNEKKVKKLRTDNGLEFCSNEFNGRLLIEAGLPKSFWAEALKTTVYLVNTSPSSAIGMKVPMEMWSGSKRNYENLRVFGSLVYSHVSKDKLDPRAQKCIMLDYTEGVKGYRLWRLDNGSWLKGFVLEMGVPVDDVVILCDNMGAIQLSKHQMFHERSKHINVKLHFIRDVLQSKVVKVEYVDTKSNVADMLTKRVSGLKFDFCLNALNIG